MRLNGFPHNAIIINGFINANANDFISDWKRCSQLPNGRVKLFDSQEFKQDRREQNLTCHLLILMPKVFGIVFESILIQIHSFH